MILNKNDAKSRIDTIDVAKSVGMLFVIFAHINYTAAPLTVIYSFHMPLYFILSGITFNRSKYADFGTFIKRRFQTLIIPYLIFQFISILFFFSAGLIFSGFSMQLLNESLSYIIQVFISQGSANMYNRPMWFVLCLFAVEIMYYFISSYKKITVTVICIFLSAVGWFLESDYIAFDSNLLPWSLDSALFALGFYAIGNLLANPIKETLIRIKSNKHRIPICIAIALICAAIVIPLALLNGKVSLGSKILNNGFLFYITGITGTVFILAISIILEKIKLLVYFGKVSFSLMGIHYLLRTVISKVYVILEIEPYNANIVKECIVPFAVITIMSATFAFLYERTEKAVRKTLFKKKAKSA